jgi:hypothetical protein
LYLYCSKMKIIATIMLFLICSLTVQPLVASVCKKAKTESCGTKKAKNCCEKKEKKSCKKEKGEDGCCSGAMCNTCMTCCCCFGATIEKSSLGFIRNSEKNNLALVQNENARSGFLSSPFQPPESC